MSRRKKGNLVHGWVFLDKPLGLGSTKAVSIIRRAFNAQKAGHAGTLDPLATGLLAVALGEATKTVPYMMDADKTYTFTVCWGKATTTCDAEGDMTEENAHRPSRDDIESIIDSFSGDIEQTPPAYSAIKIDGQRAYDLARAGEQVDMKKRQVHIASFKLIDIIDEDHASFKVTCSKGTYVRSLAWDMALALDTMGHVSALRRIASGGISIDQCVWIERFDGEVTSEGLMQYLHPVDAVLGHMQKLDLDDEQAARVAHGNTIQFIPNTSSVMQDEEVLLMHNGEVLAIAEANATDLQPVRVFNMQ